MDDNFIHAGPFIIQKSSIDYIETIIERHSVKVYFVYCKGYKYPLKINSIEWHDSIGQLVQFIDSVVIFSK